MGSGSFIKKRGFYFVLVFFVVVAIFSLTIGRDLYLGRPSNISSFAIIHFAGYLFFLIMPVEAAYIYFMAQHGNPLLLFVTAVITAIAALIADYYCGFLLSKRVIARFVTPQRYERSKSYILKYGNLTIFIFNLLPLSSPLLILAAGMLKYPFGQVLFYSILGLIFKYLIISFFFI
jgi:membrane protein DedA with SNARE-associated domain